MGKHRLCFINYSQLGHTHVHRDMCIWLTHVIRIDKSTIHGTEAMLMHTLIFAYTQNNTVSCNCTSEMNVCVRVDKLHVMFAHINRTCALLVSSGKSDSLAEITFAQSRVRVTASLPRGQTVKMYVNADFCFEHKC